MSTEFTREARNHGTRNQQTRHRSPVHRERVARALLVHDCQRRGRRTRARRTRGGGIRRTRRVSLMAALGVEIGGVSAIARLTTTGVDTPIIDLFLDNDSWQGRMVGIFTSNTPEEIAAFEKACGVKLTALPLYETAAPAKRDDARIAPYRSACPPRRRVHPGDNPRWEAQTTRRIRKQSFSGGGRRRLPPPRQCSRTSSARSRRTARRSRPCSRRMRR